MAVRVARGQRALRGAGDLNVMVVEDNDMIARLLTHMLEGELGFAMTFGGSDAAALMDTTIWDDTDVALVDLLLPDTTGDELLGWLAANAPHVKRVAMSGAGQLRLDEATSAHIRLLKPFMLDDLLEAWGLSRRREPRRVWPARRLR